MDTTVYVSLTEKIHPDSLDWQAVPDPGGWIFTWDESQSAVTATHAIFQEGITYAITLGARDLAGNQMAQLFSWSFSTMSGLFEIYLPLVTR